jgi:lysozyme
MAMTDFALPTTICDAIIDVSHYNGTIDWPAVAAAGIALVFVKATQGTGFVDPTFARNRDGAAQAGLLVVPYHFIDTGDPDDQADHFLDVTGLASGQPAMIDWETAAPAASVVAFGEALAECAGRDPLAYYGYAQLRQAEPTLARWP